VRRYLALACAGVIAAASLSPPSAAAPASPRLARVPPLVLWAWERPEDLRNLDARVGIAFLAQTITLADGTLTAAPRRQRLRVAPAHALIAVTRIESPAPPAALDDEHLAVAAASIAATASLPQVVGVQVDFDAVRSERALYAGLVRRVRARLGDDVPLSITALASWCAGDRWLSALAADEAVAMMFRLGPINEPYRALASSRADAAEECGAVGVSLDEPMPLRPGGRRVYVFNPAPWTAESIRAATEVAR
jgi:hypothetical protein